MPSSAFHRWSTERQAALNEIENAHREVEGSGPGRRYATRQINQAYAVLLASQFQGFCRELHTESAGHLANTSPLPPARSIIANGLTANRKLDFGNANSDNLRKDFARFGVVIWLDVEARHKRNRQRRLLMEELNVWRNAIAHQDIDPSRLGRSSLQLSMVRRWRSACQGLAVSFDDVMGTYLGAVLGAPPW